MPDELSNYSRHWLRLGFAALSIFLAIGDAGIAEEPEADPKDLPRIAPTPPDKALDTFRLRPGIALELAAHEPVVEDPIAVAFDEDGRLFAVEMRGYSELRDENRGRIRMLFDDDDDGVFERSTVYAGGLAWPTGLVCSGGGVFVVATPNLYFFRDTDGDGVADEKKIVFTGFGKNANRLNVQGLPNSLHWGPDNRIWGAASTVGGKISRPDDPEKAEVNLSGSDFSFDPKTFDFRAENGRAQYGLSFDSIGRRFVCSNSNHLIAVMWERQWTRPNPHYFLPKALESIPSDGGAAPVFRLSPDEPWRIVRTRWRVAGVVRGMVEGGGRVSGYFTGASGVAIYTGDALGKGYRDNAFTGDVGSNLVHRKIISHREGLAALRGDRPEDEKTREFIASTDNWFRPASYSNGPDGCLYICDMYREVIEHPWSIPPGIKKHLDLNSGTDRGRIYRVRPKEFDRRKTPKLSEFSNNDLAKLLDHPNGWHRATAQRLLWERGDNRAEEGWGKTPPSGTPYGAFRHALAAARSEPSQEKVALLAERLLSSPADTWLAAATLNAMRSPAEAAQLLAAATQDGVSGKPYLTGLCELIGAMNDEAAVSKVFALVGENAESGVAVSLLEALGSGLARAKTSLSKADKDGVLRPVFDRALEIVSNADTPQNNKIGAIRLLAFAPGEKAAQSLKSILTNSNPAPLQEAALESLAKGNSPGLARWIAGQWKKLSKPVQSRAVALSLQNASRTTDILSAVSNGRIPKTALNQSQIDLLRSSKNAAIKKQTAALFPPEKKVPRSAVVTRYEKALKLNGDPKRGAEIYTAACASCHRHGDKGFEVGPSMETFKTAGKDSIVANLFDPNREVAPQYQAYVFTLGAGEQLLGVIANETTTSVTVRMQFGVEKTFPRTNVQSMKALGKSLMPEGLEATIDEQAVADLLSFIAQ